MTLTNVGSLDQFLNQMRRFQRDIDRMWDHVQRSRVLQAGYPALNIREDAESVLVEAELPGVLPEDLDVQVIGTDQLVLKGERKVATPEGAICHRQERGFGKFSRSLPLPCSVDPDKVEAKLDHGMLRLRLAKSQAAKAKRITVQG